MQLSEYRSKAGLKLKELGLRIGVSAEAVRRYEAGTRLPTREIMERIRAATDGKVQPNDFFKERAA